MGVVLVTVVATAERHAPEALALVAFRAREAGVTAAERIPSSFMVESADPPRAGVVTSFAIGSQGRLVAIAVAVDAVGKADPFPLLVRMTALTLQALMGPLQAKCRSRVIESNVVELHFRRVTPLAVFSQSSTVNVGMAGDATSIVDQIRRRLGAHRRIRGLVALFTILDRAMKARQRVARFRVIELGRVPAEKAEILPLMLQMAADTVARLVAVKPSARADALGQILVTVEALLRLGTSAWSVAGRAVGKTGELRMRAAQRARRNQRIQFLSSCLSG
jgi:hypothetical protein